MVCVLVCAVLATSEQWGYSARTNDTFLLRQQTKTAPSVYPHSALNQVWKGAGLEVLSHPVFTLIAILCLAVSAALLVKGKR